MVEDGRAQSRAIKGKALLSCDPPKKKKKKNNSKRGESNLREFGVPRGRDKAGESFHKVIAIKSDVRDRKEGQEKFLGHKIRNKKREKRVSRCEQTKTKRKREKKKKKLGKVGLG